MQSAHFLEYFCIILGNIYNFHEAAFEFTQGRRTYVRERVPFRRQPDTGKNTNNTNTSATSISAIITNNSSDGSNNNNNNNQNNKNKSSNNFAGI
jgi:hypothetical protein